MISRFQSSLAENEEDQMSEPREGACEDCGGAGTVPTVEGQESLAFLHRHLHIDKK